MRPRSASVRRLLASASAGVAVVWATAAPPRAETRLIDAARSRVTVRVFKSGLFSAFADNHVINAHIASGTISEDAPLAVSLTIRSADLQVLDPNLSSDRRADVQARMLGPEVLDVSKFPEVSFASTTIAPGGPDRWQVTGRLTMHGHVGTITFPVVRTADTYRGDVALKQRDFGIEPIKIAGGAVKVKDEIKVEFEIAIALRND